MHFKACAHCKTKKNAKYLRCRTSRHTYTLTRQGITIPSPSLTSRQIINTNSEPCSPTIPLQPDACALPLPLGRRYVRLWCCTDRCCFVKEQRPGKRKPEGGSRDWEECACAQCMWAPLYSPDLPPAPARYMIAPPSAPEQPRLFASKQMAAAWLPYRAGTERSGNKTYVYKPTSLA